MQMLLKKMVQSPEFEVIRKRMGWTVLYVEGADFYAFLEAQETTIGAMLRELGFSR